MATLRREGWSKREIRTVLLVDDERQFQGLILRCLDLLLNEGVAARTCETLAQAEELLRENDFDLVIAGTDLGPVGGEGFELLRLARSLSPRTRFVMVSGEGGPELEREARRLGASGFFEKPMDPVAFGSLVSRLGAKPREAHEAALPK